MARVLALLVVLATLAPTSASAGRITDMERAELQARVGAEAAGFGVVAGTAGGIALGAHIGTPLRMKLAPQVGFVSMSVSATGLVQLGILGGISGSIRTTRTARGLRSNLRRAAWFTGMATIPVGIASGVAGFASGWTDPSLTVAWMHLPLNFVLATVQLSVWANRMERVRRGERPFFTQRGRPRPLVIPAGTGLAIVW